MLFPIGAARTQTRSFPSTPETAATLLLFVITFPRFPSFPLKVSFFPFFLQTLQADSRQSLPDRTPPPPSRPESKAVELLGPPLPRELEEGIISRSALCLQLGGRWEREN